MTQTKNIEFVDTKQRLDRIAERLSRQPKIAVDMEADSLHHYQERVCLIQIALPDESLFVIDPLNIESMDALKPVFLNQKIQKIFHGADFDIRSLFRDFNIVVNNLFDTELAARFLGVEQTGLAHLVKLHFGAVLEKKYRKKDWTARPLSKEMMTYAAHDTAYLIPLAEILEKALVSKNRLTWVQSECGDMTGVRFEDHTDEPFFQRFKGAGRLDRRSLAVLEAILVWRDNMARIKDRPHFKVLGAQGILGVAQKKPQTIKALSAAGLSPKEARIYGEGLIEAVRRGMSCSAKKLPEYQRAKSTPRPSRKVMRKMAALKRWRDRRAEKLDMDPSLLINKETMRIISTMCPDSMDALKTIETLKKWQRKAFGDRIIRVIQQ